MSKDKKPQPHKQFSLPPQIFDAFNQALGIQRDMGSKRGTEVQEASEIRSTNFKQVDGVIVSGWRLTRRGLEVAITDSIIIGLTESIEDTIGGILADSDTVDLDYDDAGDTISANVRYKDSDTVDISEDALGLKADVIYQMSIIADALGIKLDGDEETPGVSKYYGTDDGGVKGYFDLPTGGSELEPLTNGDPTTPELIFSDGDVIMA